MYKCGYDESATPRSKRANGKAAERGVPVGRTCARATRAYLFARPHQRRASAQTTVARGIRLKCLGIRVVTIYTPRTSVMFS